MNLENLLRKKGALRPLHLFSNHIWSSTRPCGRVCVCVDLLKRSKTRTMHVMFISLLLVFFITHRCISTNVIFTSTSRGIPAQKISGGDFCFYFNKQGGSESLSIHCPTKTVVRDCDIVGGRFEDVPAISHMT